MTMRQAFFSANTRTSHRASAKVADQVRRQARAEKRRQQWEASETAFTLGTRSAR